MSGECGAARGFDLGRENSQGGKKEGEVTTEALLFSFAMISQLAFFIRY